MEPADLPRIPNSQRTVARPNSPSKRVCLISLGGEVFAIDLQNVGEVFEVEGITPVPAMPSALAGVANVRGTIVPIADLRSVLRLPANDPLPFAVVIRHGDRQLGVLVDRVPEIRTIHMEDLLPATGGSTGPKPFVSSVLSIEGRIGGVVEVPTLLAYVETS
jgi:purine-binding chemotaxis protein CheW